VNEDRRDLDTRTTNEYEQIVYNSKGNLSRGKQRETWIDSVKKDIT